MSKGCGIEFPYFGANYPDASGNVGVLGKVVDVRRYGRFSQSATHYLVKFTCYKIPHVYFISDIDDICELYKVKRD